MKNIELFLDIKFQKPDDFKNPFIYYYPGCSRELPDKIKTICLICYKIIKESKVFPASCEHAFFLNVYQHGKPLILPAQFVENFSK